MPTKQQEGMAPWLAADPQSELAKGNEETPQERMQQHWDVWPQNEEWIQTHADEQQHHQEWWTAPQLQEWAVDGWNVYDSWMPTNMNDMSQRISVTQIPAEPPVKKQRGERGGKNLKWWTGLHKAKKNGPQSEAAFRQQNPYPMTKPGYKKGKGKGTVH